MSANFTPGPWQNMHDHSKEGLCTILANVDGDTHSDGSISYSYDFICTCADEYGEYTERAEANARLIKSAPALYDAADKARILIGAGNDNLPEAVRQSRINEAWHILDAAIKQASNAAFNLEKRG